MREDFFRGESEKGLWTAESLDWVAALVKGGKQGIQGDGWEGLRVWGFIHMEQ